MYFDRAILVHSWLSWACAKSITDLYDHSLQATLFIFSRCFKPTASAGFIPNAIRFEPFENQYLLSKNTYTDKELQSSLCTNFSLRIHELIIPHLGYDPFCALCLDPRIKQVSFYQEGLQHPKGTLAGREAELLLDTQVKNTLFTTTSPLISSKLTNIYYNLDEPLTPLTLKSKVVNQVTTALTSTLKNTNSHNRARVDYLVVLGKSMNSTLGQTLLTSIVGCLRHHNHSASILLKASPSSSVSTINHIRELQKQYPKIMVSDGSESIELDIIYNSYRYMISENFSLAALFLETSKLAERFISVEATIIRDYPQLTQMLSDRMSISRFRNHALSFQSLSEHLASLRISNE